MKDIYLQCDELKSEVIKKISSVGYEVLFGNLAYKELRSFINKSNYSQVFVLVDGNTKESCLPIFMKHMEGISIVPIEILDGEIYKTIDTCTKLWKLLSEYGADRKSVLINLGGGVVTDLGGFVACVFKRGIDFVNIPTTLLSMVDASVGGKNAVDLGGLKNQIGIIQSPAMVIVDSFYLNTLTVKEFESGVAEMLKHTLIADEKQWNYIKQIDLRETKELDALIYNSISIKNKIVSQDMTEKGVRKHLNFGHTLGHAIETYMLNNPNKKTLTHGNCVAIGIVLATKISSEKLGFPLNLVEDIRKEFKKYFKKYDFKKEDIKQILTLLKHDKKNTYGNVNFVLLKKIGEPIRDCNIKNESIYQAFEYYMKN